jgi:hypothetical protein
MDHSIISFLKFGSEERIIDMYQNGTIYINTIEYFKRHKDEKGRGDPYEGASRIINYPPGEIKIVGQKIKYLNLHIKESHQYVLGNICSFYCISSHGFKDPAKVKIDSRMGKFGDYCLIVKDNKTFLRLIEEKLQSLKQKYVHGFVTYYDTKKINGEVSLFQKPKAFAYQKEFRLYVENDKIAPISFQIGSLAGIAEVHHTKNILGLRLIKNSH